MKRVADIAVYSPDGTIQLVVEVKNRKRATDAWANQLRRNLVAHSAIPAAKFFLLVLPEYSYLWRDNTSVAEIPADYKVPTGDIFRPYIKGINLEEISGLGLEFLARAWLADVISSHLTRESAGPELTWLFDSDLYESIKSGSVKSEVVV